MNLHDEDVGGGIVAGLLATLVGGVLWVGIFALARWVATLPPEVGLKAGAAVLLACGSGIVIWACYELDR